MGAPRLRGRRRAPPFPLGARLLQAGRPLVVGEGAAASSVARAGRSEGGGWPKLRRVRVGGEGGDGHRAAPEKKRGRRCVVRSLFLRGAAWPAYDSNTQRSISRCQSTISSGLNQRPTSSAAV